MEQQHRYLRIALIVVGIVVGVEASLVPGN